MNSGRLTGLEMTVIAVLFSISRLTTPAAQKAAKNNPLSSSVLSPKSSRSLSSSSKVNAAKETLNTIIRAVASSRTPKMGCRTVSTTVLDAIVTKRWNIGETAKYAYLKRHGPSGFEGLFVPSGRSIFRSADREYSNSRSSPGQAAGLRDG